MEKMQMPEDSWIPMDSTNMFFTASSAGATVLATTESWGKIC